MSSSTVYRLSGVVLIASSLFIMVSNVLLPGRDALLSSWYVSMSLLNFIGAMLFLLSLPALYARLHKQIGVVGLIGFALIVFAGLMLGIGAGMLDMIVSPYLAQHAPSLNIEESGPPILGMYFLLAGIIQILGVILFGSMTLRVGAVLGTVRWAGLLVIIGGIGDILGHSVLPNSVATIGTVLFAAGFIWLGYFLVTEQQAAVRVMPAPSEA